MWVYYCFYSRSTLNITHTILILARSPENIYRFIHHMPTVVLVNTYSDGLRRKIITFNKLIGSAKKGGGGGEGQTSIHPFFLSNLVILR